MGERNYFAEARVEMLRFLPQTCRRLLDVGCGRGATTAAIRARGPLDWAGGVELVETEAARIPAGLFDEVWTGDAEALAFQAAIAPGSLDAILCLDVLEHMVDPWSFVRRTSPLLRPGGRLIVSVPNIRNWKFIRKLLFQGDFRYRDAGLLDRTHLRFFVKATAEELATVGGLALVSSGPAHPWKPLSGKGLLSAVSGGGLDELMTKQLAVVAEAPETAAPALRINAC